MTPRHVSIEEMIELMRELPVERELRAEREARGEADPYFKPHVPSEENPPGRNVPLLPGREPVQDEPRERVSQPSPKRGATTPAEVREAWERKHGQLPRDFDETPFTGKEAFWDEIDAAAEDIEFGTEMNGRPVSTPPPLTPEENALLGIPTIPDPDFDSVEWQTNPAAVIAAELREVERLRRAAAEPDGNDEPPDPEPPTTTDKAASPVTPSEMPPLSVEQGGLSVEQGGTSQAQGMSVEQAALPDGVSAEQKPLEQTPLGQKPLEPRTEVKNCSKGASQWEIVKFARRHGRTSKLSRREFATWAYRLDIEQGRMRPYEVVVDPLPETVSAAARVSFDGFVYLLQCCWLHTPGEPAAWTDEFAAAWCGMSERTAKDARQELVALGALVYVGEKSGWAKLWLPWGIGTSG
jgi:hypothetical protein